jgi:hypothetical protein
VFFLSGTVPFELKQREASAGVFSTGEGRDTRIVGNVASTLRSVMPLDVVHQPSLDKKPDVTSFPTNPPTRPPPPFVTVQYDVELVIVLPLLLAQTPVNPPTYAPLGPETGPVAVASSMLSLVKPVSPPTLSAEAAPLADAFLIKASVATPANPPANQPGFDPAYSHVASVCKNLLKNARQRAAFLYAVQQPNCPGYGLVEIRPFRHGVFLYPRNRASRFWLASETLRLAGSLPSSSSLESTSSSMLAVPSANDMIGAPAQAHTIGKAILATATRYALLSRCATVVPSTAEASMKTLAAIVAGLVCAGPAWADA